MHFLGGPVVSLPASAECRFSPGQGNLRARGHAARVPATTEAHVPRACAHNREAATMRKPMHCNRQ